MKLKVEKIYKLKDDYQDIILYTTSVPSVAYEEVILNKRTFGEKFFDEIFLLEPKSFYKIQYDLNNEEIVLNNKLIKSGILTYVDNTEHTVYLYNVGNNIVSIQYGTIIGESS